MGNGIIKVIADHKQNIKRILPTGFLRYMKKRYLSHLMRSYKKEPIDPKEFCEKMVGVNLIGDIRAEIGLGQSMRLLANELEESDYEFGIYDFQLGGNLRRGDRSWEHRMREEYPYGINLFHINFQEIGLAYLYLDRDIWKGRYNIAFWLWELEEFPKEDIEALRFFDEIWTPSEFSSDSIRKVTEKPVFTIPYQVLVPADNAAYDRAYFDLPEDQFLYLIMYDTNSTMARKNPVGALEAYMMAFDMTESDVGLVIKVNNATEEDIAIIKEKITGYQNVYFITETLDKVQVNSLIAAVDVFISLHRAEGFGLVMAEAMLLGTACVATDWSSNTEFMNQKTACMVPYEKVEISETSGNYKKGYMWAEPDIKSAAVYIRKLRDDRVFYTDIVESARKSIGILLGENRIVTMLNGRLGEICEQYEDSMRTAKDTV